MVVRPPISNQNNLGKPSGNQTKTCRLAAPRRYVRSVHRAKSEAGRGLWPHMDKPGTLKDSFLTIPDGKNARTGSESTFSATGRQNQNPNLGVGQNLESWPR